MCSTMGTRLEDLRLLQPYNALLIANDQNKKGADEIARSLFSKDP
jgi:hypothetical protein